MNLTVDSGTSITTFNNTIDYSINDAGELDVHDTDGVTIATFAEGKWCSIRRHKEQGEEWPDYLFPDGTPDEGGEEGNSGVPGFSSLKLARTEKQTPASPGD